MRHLPWTALLLLVSGCSLGLHSGVPEAQVYLMRIVPAPAAAAAPLAATLKIRQPLAFPGLDTERIVLLQADRRMSYYAASRWPAPLPAVIEALASDEFRATGTWAAVHDSQSPFTGDYFLEITIRSFAAEYAADGGPPRLVVRLGCAVGRGAGRELIATFDAEGTAVASANRLGAVVAGFEQAVNTALASAAVATAAAVRKSPNPSPP